jgi:hypothetical protein
MLEQLDGSATLFGTLTIHRLLPPFKALTLLLLTFWTLSHIGLNAILNTVAMEDFTVNTSLLITCLNTQKPSCFSGGWPYMTSSIDMVYSTSIAIAVSIANSSVDAWDNDKIPPYKDLVPLGTNDTSAKIEVNKKGVA